MRCPTTLHFACLPQLALHNQCMQIPVKSVRLTFTKSQTRSYFIMPDNFFIIMVKITSNSRLLMLNCTDSWVQSFCHSWKGERNWEVWDGGFRSVALWEEEV